MISQELIQEVEAYCAATGIKPSTLGVRALGNSRFFDRAARRREKAVEDAQRLRAFMAANPPAAKPSEQSAA